MSHENTQRSWIHAAAPRPRARLRLFCFPHAGGGASSYHAWGAQLAPDIELCAVRLPGREGRLAEPPPRSMQQLVALLSDGLAPSLDRGFALFGHSLGATVAFELARSLRRHARPTPVHLFVSGCAAPHLRAAREAGTPALHALPDDVLIAGLRQLGGVPSEIMAVPELLSVVLPTLRADLELDETYVHRAERPLDCPITAFGGLEDETVARDQLEAWRDQTRARFALHLLPGNHFFLHTGPGSILAAMTRDLGVEAVAS